MAKKREKPFKRKVVEQKKEHPLEKMCDAEQLSKLRNAISRGGVFICTGTKSAPIKDFYHGLRMEMKVPTGNGANVFDTDVVFAANWLRPVFILTLNDVGNKNILHSIREIKEGKVYSRYVYHPE